jgi:hypothetical protein
MSVGEVRAVNVAVVTPGTLAVATAYAYAFKVPSASTGGAITITSANVSQVAAHATGSAPNFRLLSAGTGGALEGTIAGSVVVTAAATPSAFTISAGTLDADHWVVVEYAGTAASAVPLNGHVQINYQMGV